jgi:hypothetical protein
MNKVFRFSLYTYCLTRTNVWEFFKSYRLPPLPPLPSGALVINKVKFTWQYLGAIESNIVFIKSLRENASAAIGENLHTKIISPKLQGKCECCNWWKH